MRERTPAEYQEIVRTATVEAERMGLLIGDLLALARTQSDREILVLEPLDLHEVTHEAAEGVRPLAARKGQTLEVAPDGALPAEGDRLKLRPALTKLLDNAVTSTPQGGTLRLTARHDHGRAIIAVRDTGPGIAAQHLPHLCEPFYRVDAARGGGSGHAGLGLALAAWLIRAHSGRLSVESRVGVGTVFTLSSPLASRAPTHRSRGLGPVQSPAPQ